jgi:hypothetical protein
MKKQTILILIAVCAMLAVMTGTALAKEKYQSIQGATYDFIPEWGDMAINNTIEIQVDKVSHQPTGLIVVDISAPWGTRYYETEPVCVKFYEDKEDKPYAVVVHRITEDGVTGFGAGLPGEYAKWKLYDSQLANGEGDLYALGYECIGSEACGPDGYDEFWPADAPPPACNDDKDFEPYNTYNESSLEIH